MVIINADDLGYSREVNKGIEECFNKGVINRATIMVNMPFAGEAAEMAKKASVFDKIGLHINLTEGEPLTEEAKNSALCAPDGRFNGTFHRSFKNRIYLDKKTREAIYKETEAQIRKYIEMGFTLFHADSHNYTHSYLSVYIPVRKLLKKYGFKSVRISRNIPKGSFSLFFLIYKGIFNILIKNLRVNGKKIKTTKYFGSVQDYEASENKKELNKSIEFMTHPLYSDGGVIDNTLPDPHPFITKEWLLQSGISLE